MKAASAVVIQSPQAAKAHSARATTLARQGVNQASAAARNIAAKVAAPPRSARLENFEREGIRCLVGISEEFMCSFRAGQLPERKELTARLSAAASQTGSSFQFSRFTLQRCVQIRNAKLATGHPGQTSADGRSSLSKFRQTERLRKECGV